MVIDLVYLWVDGNDPQWQAKRNAILGNAKTNTETNGKGRYANNDELKYSLRSVEKYAPWIRNVFIVTDEQKPDWIDVKNLHIKIVSHKDILPKESLPCFNSRVIEAYLYKIPGLSEHFLYANDDMFFHADVKPDFFFMDDGFPIVRLKKKLFGKWHYWVKFLTGKKPSSYRTSVYKAATLVEKKFGKYYSGNLHHNIDAYKKSDLQDAMENVFAEQAKVSLQHRIRHHDDLNRAAVLYYVLAIGHGHLKYVNNNESMRISVHKKNFMECLQRFNPKMFCLNDSQRVEDADRKRIKPFLEKLFPEKSAFEL